jgi:hypothetical protein
MQRNFFKNPAQFRSSLLTAKSAIALVGGVEEEHVTTIQRMRIVTFRDKDGVPDPVRSIHLECVGVIIHLLGDAPGSGDGYFTRVALRCESEKRIRKPILWLLSTPSFWNGMCKAVADRWFEQDGTPKFSGEVGMYKWEVDGTMTSVCSSREQLLKMPEPWSSMMHLKFIPQDFDPKDGTSSVRGLPMAEGSSSSSTDASGSPCRKKKKTMSRKVTENAIADANIRMCPNHFFLSMIKGVMHLPTLDL